MMTKKLEKELRTIEFTLDACRKGLLRASATRIAWAETRAAELLELLNQSTTNGGSGSVTHVQLDRGWIYPAGYHTPAPAPPGYRLIVERDCFMGLVSRWRYEKEAKENRNDCTDPRTIAIP